MNNYHILDQVQDINIITINQILTSSLSRQINIPTHSKLFGFIKNIKVIEDIKAILLLEIKMIFLNIHSFFLFENVTVIASKQESIESIVFFFNKIPFIKFAKSLNLNFELIKKRFVKQHF